MLDDLGLVPALKWYAREVSRTSPMEVEVEAEAFGDDLPEEHRTCVFRVVQEAVRNAGRHSGARQVRISIREDGPVLAVSIRDDGRGFDPSQDAGLGILGMQERALHLGGQLEVRSGGRGGAIVTLLLPLRERSRGDRQAASTEETRRSPHVRSV
jgi:signal transduction histidine kinase